MEPIKFYDPKSLRKCRRESELTQEALAKLAKVSRATIAGIESGRQPLAGEVARRLWTALASAEDRLPSLPASFYDIDNLLKLDDAAFAELKGKGKKDIPERLSDLLLGDASELRARVATLEKLVASQEDLIKTLKLYVAELERKRNK